jgi:hypothetical protein
MILFAWLWLATLAIFVIGLKSAWLTGQADPWAWGAPMLLLFPLGLALRRSALWAGAGAAAMALLFCGLAAARWPGPVTIFEISALAMGVAAVGWLLRERRWWMAALGIISSFILLWFGPSPPIVTQADRPRLAVITALPLFWREGGAGLAAPVDAPIISVLRTRFDVTPIDDPRALAGSGARLLLLAQPRAMPPEALVAIDAWVRDGGTILVLADPLLRWPSALPLGDRRRPPPVDLLGPLLTHWGFRADHTKDEEIRYLMPDHRLVTLSGVQVFLTGADDRWVGPDGRIILRRRIGRGEAMLLGDADPIDDRLWLADPARPLDPRAWSADTPALVANWLGGALPLDRRWMREPADVMRAIRWALLLGTGWALIGAMAVTRKYPPNNKNKT